VFRRTFFKCLAAIAVAPRVLFGAKRIQSAVEKTPVNVSAYLDEFVRCAADKQAKRMHDDFYLRGVPFLEYPRGIELTGIKEIR